MQKLFLSFVVLLIVCLPAWAAAPEPGVQTRELMEKSGLAHQIEQIPDFVRASVDQYQGKLREDVYEWLQEAARDAYSPDTLQRRVAAQIDGVLDAETIESALAWLRSDLGQRITQAENAASEIDNLDHMRRFAAELEEDPPSLHRLSLVRRLDLAVHATDILVESHLLSTLGLVKALRASMPDERQGELDQLVQRIESQRPQLVQAYQEVTRIISLYSYRDLDDEDLERYLAFAESAHGQRYHAVLLTALRDAMLAANQDMVTRFIEALKPAGDS